MSWRERAKPISSSWRERATPIDIEPESDVSTFESTIRGLGQGATLGFQDEIAGGLEAAYGKYIKGEEGDLSDLYGKYRDESRDLNFAASEANPIAYGTGELGGSIATAFVPGLNIAKGAKMATVAGKSALQGGLAALGSSTKEDVPGMAQDVLEGGTLGAAFGTGGQLISKGISKFNPKTLKEMADTQYARALGAEKSTVKSIGKKRLNDIADYARENELFTPLADTDDVIARKELAKKASGKEMGAILDLGDSENLSTFNPQTLAGRFENDLGKFYRNPLNKSEANLYDDLMESVNMLGEGNISFKNAQALKESIGEAANWKKKINLTPKEELARKAYFLTSDYLDESLDFASKAMHSSDSNMADKLQRARKVYAGSKGAEELLWNKEARELGNKMFGLTDAAWGGGAYAATAPFTGGSPIAAMATVAAQKGLEKYGNQNIALGLDRLSSMLEKSPQSFGKFGRTLQEAARRGGNALGVTNFILQQQDPEYREQIRKLQEEE